MYVKKVGVVGSGIMGAGIAHTCAQSGYQVVMSDLSGELVDKGLREIASSFQRDVDEGKMSSQDKDIILARIKGTTEMTDFMDCDLIVEAVSEKLELKRRVFAQLDTILPAHAVMATNTSVLSVTDIACATKRPEKVMGMHFGNPVPVTRIVEVVRTLVTDEETIQVARVFSESIGKKIVVAKDEPGFIINRILSPFLLTAVRLVESGVASKEDIDTMFTEGLGHPIGPLMTIDHIGIDTFLLGVHAIYDELKDPQYNPPPLLRKMVALGWLGQKTGKGFYEY